MKKYSFIIPMYNAEFTIRKCLDSILKQKTVEFDIIIINDGSVDNCLEICQKYQKQNQNIKIFNQNNCGPSVARNIGIQNATTEYIIFVDSDDYISHDFFEVIDEIISSYDIDILKYNVNYHGDRISKDIFNTESFQITNGGKVLEKLIDSGKIFATPWQYVIKRTIFTENGLFFSENHIHEDYGLIPCIIIKSKRMMGIDYKGYNYVYTENSLSTNQKYEEIVRRSFDMIVHYDFLYNFARENIKNNRIKRKFLKYIENNLIIKAKKLHNPELDEFLCELNKRGLSAYFESQN